MTIVRVMLSAERGTRRGKGLENDLITRMYIPEKDVQ